MIFKMNRNDSRVPVPATARRSGLPRLTSAFPSVLQSRFLSSSSESSTPPPALSPPSESFLAHSSSPLSRFQPLTLKRVFSSQSHKEKEPSRNTEPPISSGCSPRVPSSSCSSWMSTFHSKTAPPAPWDISPSGEVEYRETWRDESSTFSRQLAKITRGSDEDIWGSCNPCLSGPRPTWPADGSLNSLERLKVTKEAVGRRVLISGKEEGTLRYFGRTAFASGHWCGIELDKPVGKNDGSVNEVIYFSCPPGHGIFAPDNKVSLLEHSETEFPMKRPKYGQNKNDTIYRLSAGSSSSSSSGMSGHSIDSRKSSGASSATYTIVGRNNDSFPTTPEEYRLSKYSKRNSGCIEEVAVGDLDMISPGDGTYEDSSLGILSPDQMPDFTAAGSTSIERSPSDEDVAALEDEVCDEVGAVAIDSSIKKWDSQGSISGIEEELLQRDISVIIRELKRKEVDSSSTSSSPSVPNTLTEDKIEFERCETQSPRDSSVRSKSKASDSIILVQEKSPKHSIVAKESFMSLEKRSDQKVAFDLTEAETLLKKEENERDVREWQNEQGVTNMTTSAASLDQGYQGDGEFDAPSEPGSVTASSPFEDPRLFEGVIDIDMDRMGMDQSSTAATDADISLADDEAELENSAVVPRDRTARIIDGKLYHNHRELVAFRQIEGGRHDPHNTSEMDSSGFYSDLDPRDDESTRFEPSPLQPLKETRVDGDLQDSVLDDTTHEDDEMMEYASVTKMAASIEEEDTNYLCTKDRQPTNDDSSLIEDEERSSTSTIRSESKDMSSSEHQPPVPSESSTATNQDQPATLPEEDAAMVLRIDEGNEDEEDMKEVDVEVKPLKGLSEQHDSAASSPKIDSDSLTPSTARNYEKPWLSKPTTPKRVEKPKAPLPPPPPMPKKNVQSKLKALLEANANEAMNEEQRRNRQVRKGRWDDVMTRIEEGKREDKVRPKVTEVKSRLMDALKAPQPISPQVERIRQERKERRERRERQAAATAVARRMSDRKRSVASNRASRAPSLDSIGGPMNAQDSRASTPEVSQHSTSSSATSGGIGTPSGRLSGAREHRMGGSRLTPNKISRLAYTSNTSITHEEPKGEAPTTPTPLPRRSKIDTSKSAQMKSQRTTRKISDPVKVLRSVAPNVQSRTSVSQPSDQLKKLEAELSARHRELLTAEEEATRANRGVEALTVLVHHLVKEYEAFSTPRLKSEIDRLCSQLTDVQLCLDESTATARRLEDEAIERSKKHSEEIEKQEEKHCLEVKAITEEHQRRTQETLEKHQLELREAITKEESKHDEIISSHKCELDRIESEWRLELDKQHERHLRALQELNTSHTQQFKKAEAAWEAREKELQETNNKILKEQSQLKQQAKKLEETLLSDKDHRLQAAKSVCTAMQNEVDSLKTVVEMRNSELHKLRDQLTDKERMTEDLESARDRVRALQAKTEDLLAQMEKKSKLERQLLADQHVLAESLQRESSANKMLCLENEELQWKLKQREQALDGSLPISTLDLVTRCSPGIPPIQEGCKSGGSSPLVTPRSQRNGSKSQSTLRSEHEKRWSHSFGRTPEEAGRFFRKSELLQEDYNIDSPPPSPRVKGVIEKSNSVSFILDLNGTFPEDPFLGVPSSPLMRNPRTPTLSRKPLQKSFSNAAIEKSSSTSFLVGRPYRESSIGPNKEQQRFFQLENGRRGEVDGRGRSAEDIPPQTPPLYPPKYNNGRGHSTTSDSSDGGDIGERVSPTGLAWTVPVHSKHIPKRYPRSKDIPHRFQLVPETPRLLQQPDEDEYEENENEFVEVLTLDGEDLSSAPLNSLFAQTPSTSVSLSDSDISQCGSRGDLSTEDESTDDEEEGTERGTLPNGVDTKWRPQDGAGEAMIFPDSFSLDGNHQKGNLKKTCMKISKSQISSAPSSDSEDPPQHPLNGESGLNGSWSEEAEADLTSSSEMQEL